MDRWLQNSFPCETTSSRLSGLGEGVHQVHQAYSDPWRTTARNQHRPPTLLSQHQVIRVPNLDNVQDYVSSNPTTAELTSSRQVFGYQLTFESDNAPMARPMPLLLQKAETLLDTLTTFDPWKHSNSASKHPLHHRDGFTAIEEDWFMNYKLFREEAHRKNIQAKHAESNSVLPWDREYTDMAYDEDFLSQESLDQELDNFYGPSAHISQQIPNRDDVDKGYANDNMQVDSVEYQRPQKPIASVGNLERSRLVVEIVPYSRKATEKAQAHTPYFKDSGICMEGDFAAELDKTSPLLSADDVGTISWRAAENADLGSSMFPDYEKLDAQDCSFIDYEHPFSTSSLKFPKNLTHGLPDVAHHLHVLTHSDDPRQYEAVDVPGAEEMIMIQVNEETSGRFPNRITHASDEHLNDSAAPDLQLLEDLYAHAEYMQGTAIASATALTNHPNRSDNGCDAHTALDYLTVNAEGTRSLIQEASHPVFAATGNEPLQPSYQRVASRSTDPPNDAYQMGPNAVRAIRLLELSSVEIEQTWQVLDELDARLPTPTPSGSNDQARTAGGHPSGAPQTQVLEADLTPASVRKSWAVVLDRSTAELPFPPLHIPEIKDTSTEKATRMDNFEGSINTLNALATSGVDLTNQVVDGTNLNTQDSHVKLPPFVSSAANGPLASDHPRDGDTDGSMFGVKFSPAMSIQMQREVCNRLDAFIPDSTCSPKSVQSQQHHPEENDGTPVIQEAGVPGAKTSMLDTPLCHGSADTGDIFTTDSSVNGDYAKSSQKQKTEDSRGYMFRTTANLSGDTMAADATINQESTQPPHECVEEKIHTLPAASGAQPVRYTSSPKLVASYESTLFPPFEEVADIQDSVTLATTDTALPSSPVDQIEDQDYHSTPPAWSPLSDATNEENRDDLNEASDALWSMRNHVDLDRSDTFSDDLLSSVLREEGLKTGTSTFAPLAVDDENTILSSPIPFPSLTAHPTTHLSNPTTPTAPTISDYSAPATPTPAPKSTPASRKFRSTGIKKGVKQIFESVKRGNKRKVDASAKVAISIKDDEKDVVADRSTTKTAGAKKPAGTKRRYKKRMSADAMLAASANAEIMGAKDEITEATNPKKRGRPTVVKPSVLKKAAEACEAEPASKKPRRSGRSSNGSHDGA